METPSAASCGFSARNGKMEEACMHAKSLQLCPTLCDPMDCSPPGSSVHGFLQARILMVPCPPPGNLLNPGIGPASLLSPTLAGGFFTTRANLGSLEEAHVYLLIAQLCLTLHSPTDCSPPACQCRRPRSDPWPQKIPHALEQLSPCATTTEHVL